MTMETGVVMESPGTEDTAIARVRDMGNRIAKLQEEIVQMDLANANLREVLGLANGRIAVLEACINSTYEVSMVGK